MLRATAIKPLTLPSLVIYNGEDDHVSPDETRQLVGTIAPHAATVVFLTQQQGHAIKNLSVSEAARCRAFLSALADLHREQGSDGPNLLDPMLRLFGKVAALLLTSAAMPSRCPSPHFHPHATPCTMPYFHVIQPLAILQICCSSPLTAVLCEQLNLLCAGPRGRERDINCCAAGEDSGCLGGGVTSKLWNPDIGVRLNKDLVL